MQKNAVLASVGSEWDFSFTGIENCMEVGYFVAHVADVKQRGYSVLEGSTNACDFSGHVCCSKSEGTIFPFPTKHERVVYIRVQLANQLPAERALCDEAARDLCNQILNAGRRTSTHRTGIMELQGIRQQKAGC